MVAHLTIVYNTFYLFFSTFNYVFVDFSLSWFLVEKKKSFSKKTSRRSNSKSPHVDLHPDWLDSTKQELLKTQTPDGRPSPAQQRYLTGNVPNVQTLRARLSAYRAGNINLQQEADQLRAKSMETEVLYRQVVSHCTGVAPEEVDQKLPALIAAVESENGNLGEQQVGRVREFLRKVDGNATQPGASIAGSIAMVGVES